MEIEILYVMLLLIFIAIIAYVFFNCNCSCNVREGFSECRCANGTPHNGYCNSGSATRWFGKVNDVCGSCNDGYKRSRLKRKNRKYTWTCDSDPARQPAPAPAPAPSPAPSPSPSPACKKTCDGDNSRSIVHGSKCQSDGYPKCQDRKDTYERSKHNKLTLNSNVEVNNTAEKCKWNGQSNGNKIKKFDDKLCTNATDYIKINGKTGAQQYSIKELSKHCNDVSDCYGWAKNIQQGDHKVKLCKKNASSTASLMDSGTYDVYTCNSDYVCPAGFELKFDSSENKYECATCPTGKYKSGKNANECLPCKTTCPSGKTLNGSCPPGSTSDTKTCKAIQTQNNNWEKKDNGISYENIYRYGYYPRNIKRIGENDLPASKKRCQDMGNECAAIYEYNWGNKKFYFAATADSEQKASNSIVNGVVEDINHIYLNGNMKSKYVK